MIISPFSSFLFSSPRSRTVRIHSGQTLQVTADTSSRSYRSSPSTFPVESCWDVTLVFGMVAWRGSWSRSEVTKCFVTYLPHLRFLLVSRQGGGGLGPHSRPREFKALNADISIPSLMAPSVQGSQCSYSDIPIASLRVPFLPYQHPDIGPGNLLRLRIQVCLKACS